MQVLLSSILAVRRRADFWPKACQLRADQERHSKGQGNLGHSWASTSPPGCIRFSRRLASLSRQASTKYVHEPHAGQNFLRPKLGFHSSREQLPAARCDQTKNSQLYTFLGN